MEEWKARLRATIPYGIAFFISFLLLQIGFLFQLRPSYLAMSLMLSFFYILLNIGWIILLFTTLTYYISPKWQNRSNTIFFILAYLFLVGTFICDQYVLITHERLDEAFFLFDWKEIWMIADPTNRITWPITLGIIALLTIPFFLYFQSKRISISIKGILIMIVIATIFRWLPFESTVHRISENRFAHFLFSSLRYLSNTNLPQHIRLSDFKNLSRTFYGGHQQLNARFPLMHPMITPSLLASELKKTTTNTPPNIKIIIVESMSSDLFGERGHNTGNLMPFMDSLSRQSLYFPNGFSTYQRTHNVLPAVLASVPNTIDGNVFQQLPFPKHFSLFNLLKKSYRTHFYCGVPLSYLNMIGLMGHYKTDFIIKHWNSKHQKHKDIIGNLWGFPDEDLFEQAQSNEIKYGRKNQKPSITLFLTISSHDPFIYPNKSFWGSVVQTKAKQIKETKLRKMVSSNAASFGSFAYVDSTLSSYFKKERARDDFNNTIYIITGDHGTELYRRNVLSKYNIPILIFSTLLKKPKVSQAIVSHNDIAPTLINFLKQSYNIALPDTVPFVGRELKIAQKFLPNRSLIFTTNKLKSTDLMVDNHVWIGNNLYTVSRDLSLKKKHNNIKKWIHTQLQQYQYFSSYTIVRNNIVDSFSYARWIGSTIKFIPKKHQLIPSLTCKPKMNYIGNSGVFKKQKTIRITLSCLLKSNKMIGIKQLPNLVLQSKKTKYLSKKWTIFRLIKPRIDNDTKISKRHKLVYSIEFNPNEITAWKKGGRIYLFLQNEGTQPLALTNIELDIHHGANY